MNKKILWLGNTGFRLSSPFMVSPADLVLSKKFSLSWIEAVSNAMMAVIKIEWIYVGSRQMERTRINVNGHAHI